MTQIITDSTGLVKQPRDPYWDGNISRREVQGAVNILATNDNELFLQATTARFIMNLFAEKLNVTPAELQAYVEREKAKIDNMVAQQAAQQAPGDSEAENSALVKVD